MWCIIPAAGIGLRMSSDVPKQYIKLDNNEFILDTTIDRVLASGVVNNIMLPINTNDNHWQKSKYYNDNRVTTCFGGDTRAQSVLNGLKAIKLSVKNDDFVMVHDAARCCVLPTEISKLYSIIDISESIGGILAAPINDTVKVVNPLEIISETKCRKMLWMAHTPQVFTYKILMQSIESALERGVEVTDESSAVEAFGYSPRVILGSKMNIKVTHPEDIKLANLYLNLEIEK